VRPEEFLLVSGRIEHDSVEVLLMALAAKVQAGVQKESDEAQLNAGQQALR